MHITQDLRERWQKPIFFGVLGLVAVVLLFWVLVGRAVPGDGLYGFKVNYAEESFETLLRFTPEIETRYHLSLLVNRFNELRSLSERDAVKEGDLWYLYDETSERANELIAHLAAEDGAGLTREEALMYTHDMATILRAIEQLTEEHEPFAFLEEDYEDLRREAENQFDDRAEQFTVHATDIEVREFLSNLLGKVLALVESRDLERRLHRNVEDNIEEAEEELAEGDGAGAISDIADALRLIEVADIFGRAESVPAPSAPEETQTDGPTLEPEPVIDPESVGGQLESVGTSSVE